MKTSQFVSFCFGKIRVLWSNLASQAVEKSEATRTGRLGHQRLGHAWTFGAWAVHRSYLQNNNPPWGTRQKPVGTRVKTCLHMFTFF